MQRDNHKNVYEFHRFRLDEAQLRLLYKDQPVPLTPKIVDLLLFLVKNRGQLITKDELMRAIWPDSFVEENNITVSMSTLRKTLSDTGCNRQFIETVPRRGYRFVAEVIELSPSQL